MFDVLTNYPVAELLAFLGAGIALNLTPGSDVMFATASGLTGGPRAGMLAGLGVGLGGVFHVVLAAAGVSAMLAAHPGALSVIRWLGAAYLLWLAWRSWNAAPLVPGKGEAGSSRAFSRGFLTNVMNPKVILFVLAFLPQFTSPAYGPVWQQILLLGTLFAITGTIITTAYGALAGVAGARLARRMGVMNRLAALVFGVLAWRVVRD